MYFIPFTLNKGKKFQKQLWKRLHPPALNYQSESCVFAVAAPRNPILKRASLQYSPPVRGVDTITNTRQKHMAFAFILQEECQPGLHSTMNRAANKLLLHWPN